MNNISSTPSSIPRAAVVGLAGTEISQEERELFRSYNPLGFILFSRNCQGTEQIKSLVADLRNIIGRQDAPVLIDQEGGRVARLRPPLFPACPPASLFAEMAANDQKEACDASYRNALLMGEKLREFGISVNCAPVADILYSGAHSIIGDRSFGDNPAQVVMLARSMCEGLLDSKVVPVIKHIPGHGRALLDSHEALPVVTTEEAILEKTDFEVFRQLNTMPWAMTAHIIYTAIDAELPATLSPKVMERIRGSIGFKGIIISDDLSMKALSGSFAGRTKQAITAGCDLALHCNGHFQEMAEVLDNTPLLSDRAQELLASHGVLNCKDNVYND